MTKFEPRDPDFIAKVRDSFSRQTAMQTLGAALGSIEPGVVEIEMPFRADFTQQHGFVHGGIITTILDSACGYAAFLAPARGERFLARGEVVRPGATVTVCKGDVLAYDGGEEKLVATMLMTMMTMPNRPNLTG